MNWLLIDTCCPRAVVGVAKDAKLLSSRYLSETKQHSELLAPAVIEALAEAGLEMKDLNGVAVGKGPGSFIGSRIAMAYAKGVCVALDIPLVGVGTLSAIGYDPGVGVGKGVAAIDARRGEFYVQTFEHLANGEVKALDEPHLYPAAQMEALAAQSDFMIRGEGPTAEGLLAAFVSQGKTADEKETLVPDYIREPDAKPLSPIKS